MFGFLAWHGMAWKGVVFSSPVAFADLPNFSHSRLGQTLADAAEVAIIMPVHAAMGCSETENLAHT